MLVTNWLAFQKELIIMSDIAVGGLGSTCFLSEECTLLLSCSGGGDVGGKEIFNCIKILALFILVTEGTCSLLGWVVGSIVGGILLLLLVLLCFCYCCCVLGRKGRKLARVASEAELVVF